MLGARMPAANVLQRCNRNAWEVVRQASQGPVRIAMYRAAVLNFSDSRNPLVGTRNLLENPSS